MTVPSHEASPRPAGFLPDGYAAVRELGAGSHGVVTLARQLSLDRLVAVKTLLGGAHAGEEAAARFLREARALARLDHRHIVRVHELVPHGHDLCLVMEHVDGASLRSLLDAGQVSTLEVVQVLADVADALDAAARAGVLHRDVKPANVLVDSRGRAKLADFGLAHVVSDTSAFRTSTATPLGSPAYLAPEGATSAAADAYSFGVLAYEALTGALPFLARDVPALLVQHREHAPPRPALPTPAADAVLAALAKDPGRRPTPRALAAVLRSIPAGEWPDRPRRTVAAPAVITGTEVGTAALLSSAVPTQSVRSGARQVVVPDDVGDVEPTVFRPRRRGLGPRGLVLLCLAVLGLGLTAWVLTAGRGGDPAVTGLELTVVPGVGSCPSTDFVVTALVSTDGSAGPVTVQWHEPDGSTTASTTQVRAGQRRAEAVLRLHVTGERASDAVVRATGGGHDASATLRYRCP